jgi:hypothetical protein
MIKYAKKIILRKFNLKNNLFSTFTFKKILKNLFKLHIDIIEHFIELIVNICYIRKVDEKYVLNWPVVQNFQNTFTLKL